MSVLDRLKKLQSEIQIQKLDAVLISSVANIIYLTDYSGFSTEEREAFLLITPASRFILTDGRYTGAVKKTIPDFELLEISSKNKLADLLGRKIADLNILSLGIEEDDLRISEYKLISKVAKNLKNFVFHEHRSIKNPGEIKLIERAGRIGDRAYKFILEKIKAGISEKELMFKLENFIREEGFEPSFKTIVAFGANAAVPHHLTGDAKLKKGDFILMDFGVKFKNYCSDMTRTVVFGKPSERQKQIHKTVLEAQSEAVKFIKNNAGKEIRTADIDSAARVWISSKNYPTIPHSLGHGIGIEVHEHPYLSPNSKEILKEGMVFSVEPGIYIENFGGVRIEDLYVYEKNGLRPLTNSPKELLIV